MPHFFRKRQPGKGSLSLNKRTPIERGVRFISKFIHEAALWLCFRYLNIKIVRSRADFLKFL